MAPLGGLSGLYGAGGPYGVTGPPLWNMGKPADPRHGIEHAGSVPTLRQYRFPDYGSELDAETLPPMDVPGGDVYDHTPASHAAPWPAGIPFDQSTWGDAAHELHGHDLGGVEFHIKGHEPREIGYTSGRFENPNVNDLSGNVPGQLRGGGVDVTQGYGHPNSGVFGRGNQFRRVASEGILFDRTLHHAGERPFLGANVPHQVRYDGVDSPYGAYGDTSQLGIRDTPHSDPTPYEQPANPRVAPVAPDYNDVQDWGWSAG